MLKEIPLKETHNYVAGELLAYDGPCQKWSVEHYVNCSFRCTYCITDTQGRVSPRVDANSMISVLANELEMAANHCHPLGRDDYLHLSNRTDPYCHEEELLGLTRQLLEYFIAIKQNITLITKGGLIERDIDLLCRHKERTRIRVSIPFTSMEAHQKYERHAPTPDERFRAVKMLHEAGLDVSIGVAPWIPGVTDVEEILKKRPRDVLVEVVPLDIGDYFNQHFFSLGNETDIQVSRDKNQSIQNTHLNYKINGIAQSAHRLFSKKWSQRKIHELYIAERNRIGFRKKSIWVYPLGWCNYNVLGDSNYRTIKPDELNITDLPE